MKTKKTEESAPQHDELMCIQEVRKTSWDYRVITTEQAIKLVDQIVPPDSDLVAYAFIELIRGIFEAARNNIQVAESLVTDTTSHAYAKTFHFSASVEKFARLDWENERDLRVLTGKLDDEQTIDH